MKTILITCILSFLILVVHSSTPKSLEPKILLGHRFLTFNTVIRVNQIEVAR